MNNAHGGVRMGAAAVTALGPGKALVAGSFGRSWCAIATFGPEKGKSFDVFFEAREVSEATPRERWSAKTVASPIWFICTLSAPATKGGAVEQRVLLARYGDVAPLLIDPEKRSVEVLPDKLHPDVAKLFGVHGESLSSPVA